MKKDTARGAAPEALPCESQCDIDPQCMADMLHLIHEFGLENLKGRKIAMTWAYSPSTPSPFPCPGVIGLMTRFGMEVT